MPNELLYIWNLIQSMNIEFPGIEFLNMFPNNVFENTICQDRNAYRGIYNM